jgi:hypothetical protein
VLQREDELLKGARGAADFHGMGIQTPKSARVYGARSGGGWVHQKRADAHLWPFQHDTANEVG